MIRSYKHFKQIHQIQKNFFLIRNSAHQYSQRCNYDDCDCIIPEPKCKSRPAVVKEVDCEKCMFECWQYKPRPRFAMPKTDQNVKKSRMCTAGMKNADTKTKVQANCKNIDKINAPIGPCPKTFTGKGPKSIKENPYKFENDRIPLPDWDFNKKKYC